MQYEFIPHSENEDLYFIYHSTNDVSATKPFDTSTVIVNQGGLELLFSLPIYSNGSASVAAVRLYNVDKLTFTISGYASTVRTSVIEIY